MHSKTIIFVAGIALGIVAGSVSPFGSELAVIALVLAGVQGSILMIARKRDTEVNQSVALSFLTALFCFAFFVGIIRAQVVEERYPYVCSDACTFEARIISAPETRDAYQTFIVRPTDVEEKEYDVQVRTSLYPTYEMGERVKVTGTVKVPKFLFSHGNEKSFDYASYLHTKNVGSEMLFPKLEPMETGDRGLVARLGAWKSGLIETINTYVSSPANTLATGMLFGNSSMSKELNETFRVAGLSHIVVLSGFNIAIVIAFVLFVFAFLPLAFRITCAALFVLLFVLMVGSEPSIVRATLMSLVGLLAMLLGREYVARQALMLSLLAIVMYDPISLLQSVSLHLSFLATTGIIYWSEPIKQIIGRFILKKFFLELFTTTLAAYAATLPYLMYIFGTVSVYALAANIVVLPLVPFAMLMSSLVLIAAYVSDGAAMFFGYADSLLIDFILLIARTINKLPFASFNLSITFFSMFIVYIFMMYIIFYFSRRKKDETLLTTKEGYLTDVISY